jgi:hypothetical protein
MTDKIKEAITEYWGERCPDVYPGCPCCDAWAEYDALSARLAEVEAERDRQYDENVHRIAEQAQAEAKLAQAVEALRRISLAEQNSGTRLSDIGREARATLAELKGEKDE